MKRNTLFLTSFYLIFLIVGIFTVKDYGIGIEEIFQRASGFYWLKFIISIFGFEYLGTLSEFKFLESYSINPSLPKVTDNLAYGIIFDLPVAFIELLINFDDFKYNIYLKHFLSFLFF